MLFDHEPADWQELQKLTHQLFTEIGCKPDIDKKIETVRGSVAIDVYVEDPIATHLLIYLCECKYWKRNFPQTIVHSFRTVVHDSGAHRGYIISKVGFQKGAIEAANNSNIDIVTWHQLQAIFKDRWIRELRSRLTSFAEQLVQYTYEELPGLSKCTPKDKQDFFSGLLFRTGCIMASLSYIEDSEEKEFPWSFTDPRSDSSNKQTVSVNSLREFYDIVIPTVEKMLADFRFLMTHEGVSRTLP